MANTPNTLSTTAERIKLHNALDPNDLPLIIQFYPQEIDISRGGRVEGIDIVGRNLPFYQYVSGEREMSFDIDFYTENEDGQDVLNKVRWLEQKTYNETFEGGACPLFIEMGEIFAANTRWVIKPPLNIKLMDFDKEKNLAPRRASVKLTLMQEDTAQGIKRSNFLSNF